MDCAFHTVGFEQSMHLVVISCANAVARLIALEMANCLRLTDDIAHILAHVISAGVGFPLGIVISFIVSSLFAFWTTWPHHAYLTEFKVVVLVAVTVKVALCDYRIAVVACVFVCHFRSLFGFFQSALNS